MVVRILADAGHSVIEAQDGSQGVRLLKEHHPKIVITDMLMPEKDGVETIQDIKKLSPGTTTLAISGGGGAIGTKLCLDSAKMLGADMILRKPFRAAELVEAVDRLLEGHGKKR